MRKVIVCLFLAVILCAAAISAQASQMLNIYIDKDALLSHDISAADIRIRPEGMVRVTRHSLWPWDEGGTQWSMFVEIENISDEKIVIDENWLVACRANRDEIASADDAFAMTDNVLDPGEHVVLYAGAYPYVQSKRNDADVTLDVWDVEGMEDFANRIRQAQILRVRLNVRGNESTQNWSAVEIEPEIWLDGRTIHFEWTNATDETLDFRTIGAVVSDGNGRIIDVIHLTHSRGAVAAPGETLSFQKELAPYIETGMIDEIVFDAFAYKMSGK